MSFSQVFNNFTEKSYNNIVDNIQTGNLSRQRVERITNHFNEISDREYSNEEILKTLKKLKTNNKKDALLLSCLAGEDLKKNSLGEKAQIHVIKQACKSCKKNLEFDANTHNDYWISKYGKIDLNPVNGTKRLDGVIYVTNPKYKFKEILLYLKHTVGEGGHQDNVFNEILQVVKNSPTRSVYTPWIVQICVDGSFWTDDRKKEIRRRIKKMNNSCVIDSVDQFAKNIKAKYGK